jgi:hypothetical protein
MLDSGKAEVMMACGILAWRKHRRMGILENLLGLDRELT